MKVVLINPPRLNEIRADNPCFIDEDRGYNPPLGLLYLASYLEKHGGYPVQVIDAQVEELDYGEQFKKRIPANDDLVVGMTAMTFTMIDVLKTISLLRDLQREAGIGMKIVLGGPHPTIYPEETVRFPGVDYVVRGEGEIPLLEICQAVSKGREPLGVRGTLLKRDQEIIDNGTNEFIEDLDRLPFPARHLTDIRKYNSVLSGRKIVTTMFTSRGCPFRCSFCDRPHQGKKFRARSAENVVDEMAECIRMGIEEILVYDDTFTVNRKRVIDICDEIIRRRLRFVWDIRSRVDTVDEVLLKKLKDAGCERIHFGVEAGTEKILEVLNKRITIDQVKKVFEICHCLKIKTLAYFMIGSPGETREDIQMTMKLARELRPDFLHATLFTPYPSTTIYHDALAGGSISRDYWQEFAQDPQQGFLTPYWYENFSREELLTLLNQFYRKFYGRPSYILSNLLQVRSFGELKKKTKMGLKVLGLME
jgi:anaerobic magnesium-protoporphyrin IX monomethyl ester cyclase